MLASAPDELARDRRLRGRALRIEQLLADLAGAVVLVVLIVAVSMPGRQKRGAQRLSETRRDAHEARVRAGQTERDRDTEHRGGEDLGADRYMKARRSRANCRSTSESCSSKSNSGRRHAPYVGRLPSMSHWKQEPESPSSRASPSRKPQQTQHLAVCMGCRADRRKARCLVRRSRLTGTPGW